MSIPFKTTNKRNERVPRVFLDYRTRPDVRQEECIIL